MNATIPSPAPTPMSPPIGAGGGSFIPPKAPAKGGLSIKVIAGIQAIYEKEELKQQQLQGMEQPLALKPGWGGQGK